jgi:hypothetical protein
VIGYARRNIRPFDDLSLRTASRRAGEISAIVDKMLYYAARGEKVAATLQLHISSQLCFLPRLLSHVTLNSYSTRCVTLQLFLFKRVLVPQNASRLQPLVSSLGATLCTEAARIILSVAALRARQSNRDRRVKRKESSKAVACNW